MDVVGRLIWTWLIEVDRIVANLAKVVFNLDYVSLSYLFLNTRSVYS